MKPYQRSSKINATQKTTGKLIIASGNGTILLEFGKEVLD
jgi:hypothetical protein